MDYASASEDDLITAIEELEEAQSLPNIIALVTANVSRGEDFETVIDEGLSAISRCLGSADLSAEIGNDITVCALKVFEDWAMSPSVIEACFALSRKVSDQQSCKESACTSFARNVSALVSCVRANAVGEGTLVEQACLTFENVGLSSPANAALSKAGGAADAVEEARGSITNERHVGYPDRALRAINGSV